MIVIHDIENAEDYIVVSVFMKNIYLCIVSHMNLVDCHHAHILCKNN